MDAAGLTPRDIDILIVNCSLFNPTPSLSAMIVNHFKMRGDVISFNLAGMGCSAGVIAIGLAQRLLRTEPGKYALVVSTENITQVRAPVLAGSGLSMKPCVLLGSCLNGHFVMPIGTIHGWASWCCSWRRASSAAAAAGWLVACAWLIGMRAIGQKLLCSIRVLLLRKMGKCAIPDSRTFVLTCCMRLAAAQNWYLGNDRSMLIPNTLFRMGGAAMVLTNKMSERRRAKYELQHVVRVHLGADDTAYECAPSPCLPCCLIWLIVPTHWAAACSNSIGRMISPCMHACMLLPACISLLARFSHV